ncbi:MAG: homoserine dehydrogenase [Deltaproteobacteria bacterium]|nr:homoserine dehydrogenase [Deltaproteobacteria bacterium]
MGASKIQVGKIQIGMIGLGTVGSGVVQLLEKNRDLIRRRLGADIQIKKIAVAQTQKKRSLKIASSLLTDKVEEVLNDPEISMVVELMGGIDPAKRYLLQAIEKGKHIVTANKAVLAHHGAELFSAAEKKKVGLGFEASVCGGIPILRALREGLVADQVTSLYGIVNGTSNYILTEMTSEGSSFEEVLKKAQEKGYAEADPRFDVNGIDSVHKLVLLLRLAFGVQVDVESIYTEGIGRVGPLDVKFAEELGYRIKLLAIAKLEGDSMEARVHPTMLPKETLLATVDGVFNAVYLLGEYSGPGLYFGSGAGGMPTATAVVSDVVDIAKNILSGIGVRGSERMVPSKKIKPIEEVQCSHYLRFMAVDQPGVLAKIAGFLGEEGIGIASVIQKGRKLQQSVPVVIMTYEAKGRAVERALAKVDQLPVVTEKSLAIRIETDLG